MYGLVVSGKDKNGKITEGWPEGIQIIDGKVRMVVITREKLKVAIDPPEGWVVRDERWIYEG